MTTNRHKYIPHNRNYYTPPYTPTLCSKTGVCRGIPIFLFLLENIDCGYSLEPPRRGGSNVYPQSMFRAKIRKISKTFYYLREICILQGRVFVMYYSRTFNQPLTCNSTQNLSLLLCNFIRIFKNEHAISTNTLNA